MKAILLNQFVGKQKLALLLLSVVLSLHVFAQVPANDNCAGAVILTSNLMSCASPVSGTLNNATRSITTAVGTSCVAWSNNYDVWYRFTAVATQQTVTTSNFGSNYFNREIQIYNTPCPTVSTGYLACGTTTATATGLTIGITYYIRISDSWTALATGGEFSICLTHPLTATLQDLCSTAFTLTSANSCNSITANLRNANSTSTTAGSCGGATLATTYDVWFRFQATSTTQTIALSNLGSSVVAATTYIETFGGTCAALGATLGCQTAATRQTLTGLTVGNFYYVRVYRTANPNIGATNLWNFDICVQSQPANDECANSTILTSNTTCSNTAGTIDLSTPNAATPLGCLAAGTYYDVWYKFIAVTTTHTVTISSLGSSFTAQRLQIYSGNCATLVSVGCVSGNTITLPGLTPGNVYYIRVANFNVNPSGAGGVANFNICVTHTNDLCSGAILLNSAATCTNVSSTLLNATATAGLPACGNNASADVWFRFVATSNHPIITLNNIGSDLNTAGPRIQLFSGSCGALTQVTGACTTSPLNTATTPGGAGLSINSVYYIRVTTNANTGTPVSGNWGFDICITNPGEASVDFAKSYINVTDGTVGGTINTGDVLEIRATLVVAQPGGGGAPSLVAIDNVAYYDTLVANRGFRLLNDSMAVRTNEGKLFRPSSTTYYTNAADADAAWITTGGAGTDTALQINMGEGANFSTRGKLRNTSKPSNFGTTCIIMATYRVRVTAAYGTTINYGGGAFSYRDTITGTSYIVNFPKDSLIVYASPGACPDGTSPTNIVGDEVNGTFGAPAGPPTYFQSRSTANTRYAFAPFAANNPVDYFYSVTNNTSASGATVQTVPKGDGSRVFNVWDITGDHTGAANTAKGNPPCNLNLPVSASNPCGYMLAVNAAYRTDVAFEYNFTGACTDTYYEISAWVKNICYRCGGDSNGVGSGSGGYIPTALGDSSGVRPNIAFEINGVDYYTTGDLVYQGLGGTNSGSDTLNTWVRRSFVYKTKAGQTGFTMSLRNNAPGGGGNDWAIDDIGIRTCYPNMVYSPSATPTVCAGRTITITDTVRSYYDTYVNYKWQRFTVSSGVWTDIAGTIAVATPVWTGSYYQYITSYTLPPTATTPANNGDLYRVVVATNSSNLSNGCGYSDIVPIAITVNNCIDIDDDNDGIPDYVETGNPVALQDANTNTVPNWNDASYTGRIDNNSDGVDDRFDAGADADNDGRPNYLDTDFLFDGPFLDTNGDGVNDRYDRDLDGIINQYDLDSDNDGIPDVVESYGADADGNGIIDGYVDVDADGFSSNVDSSIVGGVAASGVGLGAQDFDGDGVPNYLDLDSDNDGIPDVVEVGGSYTSNNGKLSTFADVNYDGISDNNFMATALLLTGAPISLTNGRAIDFPFKNLDRDFRPNAYDMDSDGDGIVDVIEAGLPDANFNGIVDGTFGINGWSTTVSVLVALNLRNTDASGNPDYLDIDSDNDGIPDNIEGMSTAGYIRPVSIADGDGDGLIDLYDNSGVFGGSGIFVWDQDGDLIPDYRDLDTDGDGQADIIEGNDFNLNGLMDDIVTLTGLDTDGDGLDNRFDSLNSVINLKGTSFNMGTGGTTSPLGDPAPGARCPVQKRVVAQLDRDWRYVSVVLPVQFIKFTGAAQNNLVPLSWTIIALNDVDHFEIERSIDNITYLRVGIVNDAVKLNQQQSFGLTDDISAISNDIIYYRLKVIGKAGEIKYSSVLIVRRTSSKTPVTIMPNPANGYVTVSISVDKNIQATIILIDKVGRKVLSQNENLTKGFNTINLKLDKFSEGVYAIIIETPAERIVKQLMIIR